MKAIETDESCGPAPCGPAPARPRRKRTFIKRINAVLIYRTTRKAIRESGAEGPILLAPCGYGWYFDWFRRDGIDIVGLDLDPQALAEARQAVTPAPPIYEANILHMPFADGQFDFILNNRFLPHFDSEFRIQALRELARVTRRYILAHYDTMSPRLFLRRLRGFARQTREGNELRGWRKTMRQDRLLLFDKERMAAEGAEAGLRVRKLYHVAPFSGRTYCLYEKQGAKP